MAGRRAMSSMKCARPLLSADLKETRRRALGLYRAYYRYIPYIVKFFDMPKNEEEIRCKIREHFYKHSNITDVRVADLLVIKGYMYLKEIRNQWVMKGQLMSHWKPTEVPRPTEFIDKFLSGDD